MQFIKRKDGIAVRFYFEKERIYLKGFKSREEAEKAVVEYRENNNVDVTNVTVEKYFQYWFENYTDDLGEKTVTRYAELIHLHILPTLGKIKLTDLKPAQIQELYTKKKKERSGTTVLSIHRLLKLAFKYGIAWEYMKYNPCDLVKAPSKSKPDIVILEDFELKKILYASKDNQAWIAFYIAATTGMRLSEILGLQIKDVDLDKKIFTVTNTYQRKNPLVLGSTKNEGSKRLVPMIPGTENFIKVYAKNKRENRLKFGLKNNFFCTMDNGEPLKIEFVSKGFKKYVRQFEFDDRIDFKSLRHYHASWLLSNNIHPKIVSERLGHSSIKITLDIYSHLIPSLQDEALSKINSDIFTLEYKMPGTNLGI